MMTNAVARATLTCGGTTAPPKKGTIATNETKRAKHSANSTRKACGLWPTSKIPRTSSRSLRNSSMELAHRRDFEYQVECSDREVSQVFHHARERDHYHKNRGDDLWNKGQGLLLDLCQRLKQTDNKTDDQTRKQRQQREDQYQPQS